MTNMPRTRSTLTLLGGCASALALAVACAAPAAYGQAFQGTPTVTSGTAFITPGSPDIIEVAGPETVIDWQPFDRGSTGTIDFLPSGLTALFRNSPNASGLTDYTVLNRIFPTDASGQPVSRIVAFNGTVQSELFGSTGGSVWFYAPGGIIAGPTSIFNVGSLVLTSNAIDITGGLYGSNGEIRFRGAVGSGSVVEVQAGAQISAPVTGSYVALVAPRVVQSGTVSVNGSSAYVGAEGADILINGGLFDINITTGTTDANGVVHDGVTNGPASTGSGDVQRVYMVAVPKNNALTMLLSGDVGYTPAAAATPDGSAIVLSAGYDIGGGDIGARSSAAGAEASFNIGAGTWQSDLTGAATGDVVVRSTTSPATHFLGNVALSAERGVMLRADALGAITADKDVSLTATSGAAGGKIDILTFDGQIGVTGRLTLDAHGDGAVGVSTTPFVGANGTGGTINLLATGGLIRAGSLTANATAFGGPERDQSGDALGGTISIGAAGGTFTTGDLSVDASAYGADGAAIAGAGTGGSITLFATSPGTTRGRFALTGCSFTCDVRADGQGGFGADGANGTGGSVLLYASDADFSVPGDLSLRAEGIGGGAATDGAAGRSGDGLGGNVTIESRLGAASSAALSFGNLFASAGGSSAFSSDGAFINGGDGGTGTGGAVNVTISGGQLTATALDVSATGLGGASDANCPTCEGGGSTPFQSGTGQGGSSNFLIIGGSATIGTLTLAAAGTGGEGEAAFNPGDTAALAGAGLGGAASLESRGGTLQLDSLTIDAGGAGGTGSSAFQADGVDGGIGTGGIARLIMTAGGTGQISVTGDTTVRALGTGGDGGGTGSDGPGNYGTGRGGGGTGGTVDVTLAGGVLSAPSLLLWADGIGGAGGDNASDGAGGIAGDGTGGTARLSYLNEGHVIGDITVKADGQGGQAGSNRFIIGFDNSNNPIYDFGIGAGGSGGRGTGGSATMLIDVDPAYANLTVSADGIGSMGGSGGTGAAGGAGLGGTAALNLTFGTTSVSGALRVTASGLGGLGGSGYDGIGGQGGDAAGGAVTLGLSGAAAILDAGDIGVLAEALGGAGGAAGLRSGTGLVGANGGAALGGTALMTLSAGGSAITGSTLRISGDATGGAGALGTAGPAGGAGGNGGNASAGSATLRIADAHMALSSSVTQTPGYSITAVGQGGAGADGSAGSNAGLSGGAGGNGGNGTGGQAQFDANNGDYALGDLTLSADGLSGVGGAGGSGPGGASANGATGLSGGGTADFVNGGSAALAPGGQRAIDSLFMSASGGTAGRVQFTDSSTAPNGGLNINGALSLSSLGVPVAGLSGIYVMGTANPVRIGGSADFNSDGLLSFAFTGAGGINVAGALTGYSGTRIDVSHGSRAVGSDSLFADSMLLQTPGDVNILPAGSLRAVNGLTMLSRGGNINLASGGALTAGTDLRLFAQGSVNGTGASVRAVTGSVAIGLGGPGNILLGDLSSGGLLDQADASGNALGTGGIAIGGDFAVSGRLDIGPGSGTLSARTITIGTLAAGSQQLTATNGAVQIGNALMTGDLIVNASLLLGDADIAGLLQVGTPATGFAQLTGQVAAGAIDIAANSITSNGLVARTGGIVLQSGTALAVADARAAGNIAMTAAGGALTIGNAVAGGTLTLTGAGIGAQRLQSGSTSLLNAGAGSLLVNDIASAGAITANGGTISLSTSGAMTIAQANASAGAMMLNAGGLLSLSGPVSAQAITLASGDIAIAGTAQVGTLGGTGSVTFTSVNGQQPAYVGGADVAGAYSLSAAELARVAGGAITIGAPRRGVAGTPDIIIRDLTVGTANLPGAGVLTITTPGRMRVAGALRLTGRSAQGGLTLSAAEALEVIAGPGSIDLGDANGGLGGVLTLTSPTIMAATLSAITDLGRASALVARELRLAQNDGVVSDGGILRAATIRANVTNGLYIQNSGLSGAFADRRGFTAGDLFITTQSGAAEIAINGQLAGSAGGFVTGLETLPLVSINGSVGGRAGGYSLASKVNGCLIASPGTCLSSGFDSRDTWNGVLDPSVSVARIFTLSLIELRDIVAQGYPPLIDEPVTGAGNEDLWESPCDAPDRTSCDANAAQ